ncbi:MAG: hypothetical protein OEO79_13150 [Gemmatimonadota bacterium]|nr:hypothetical protein [Gemmatimonadota bacterium]
MNTTMDTHSNIEHRLAATGWGLFFVWLGIAILAGVPNWVSLVGIGVITLGIQVTRRTFGLDLEMFWLAVGLFFVLGGMWDFAGATVPLLPVLLILVGAAIVASVMGSRKS